MLYFKGIEQDFVLVFLAHQRFLSGFDLCNQNTSNINLKMVAIGIRAVFEIGGLHVL